MQCKGVFPCDYLNSENRLNEAQLPRISAFFNKLTNGLCSLEGYEHAQKVWKIFKCITLKAYLLLY